MKFDSSDLLAILRLYGQAESEYMPRHIERIEKSHPHDKNTLIRFTCAKKHYALLIDPVAEDDEAYVLAQANDLSKSHDYTLLPNPKADDLMTFGVPFKGKDCYLLRDEPSTMRLDLAMVDKYGDESRSTYQKFIASGFVKVNGEVQTSAKAAIKKTDVIVLEEVAAEIVVPDIEILYEDDHVLVINKPSGLLTHAKGAVAEEFTAADFIKDRTSYKQTTNRPGIVHRLDRDTSGVLLMVKTEEAATLISRQFSDRKVKKTYAAITSGVPGQSQAVIDLPIGRNPSAPSTFRVDPNGKTAQTTFEVKKSDGERALVELRPKTGRTHQLRVHLAYIKAPILGDKVYGKEPADRMYLHAYSLEVTVPGGQRKTFTAPTPDEFVEQLHDVTS